MSLPPYPKYKDSGVEWLGEVPEHWTVKRLGAYFDERREKVSDKDFPALSVTKAGIVPQIETAAKTDDGDNRKKVCVGDFVINSRSDRKGSSGVSPLDGSVSLINTVLSPSQEITAQFVHFLLRSQPFQEEYYRYGKGIVADLWSTNYSEMRNIMLALPAPTEQYAVATFVDRETGKIDALVEEQQRLIELLKEKRQAVISHAVTKGLNPDAPIKDSGVEWIGDAPQHWQVLRVKHVSMFTTSGPRGWSERISEVGSIFVQSGDLDEKLQIAFDGCKRVQVENGAESSRTLLANGDTVVCITGAKTGNVAVCEGLHEPAYVNQHLCLIRATEDILPRFLGLILKSRIGQTYFEISQYGLKQGLSLENVREAPVLLPPLSEQRQILDFLDLDAKKFSGLFKDATAAIDLLQERRTALISAAVTGKIDVRGMAKEHTA